MKDMRKAKTKDNADAGSAGNVRNEKSAGAVIYFFDEKEEKPRFLLLKYRTYWGFAKGIIEPDEGIEETVKREIREETGLCNIYILPGFRHIQRWFYRSGGMLVSKEAVFLLARVAAGEAENVKISFEHKGFKWLGYDDALRYLKIKNNKEMLKQANDFIKEYEKQKRL